VSEVSLAIKHIFSSSSSLDVELEEESSLSCHAMYTLLTFPLFFYFLSKEFSLLKSFGHSILICPCFPQPKQVQFEELKSIDFFGLYMFEECDLSLLFFLKNLPNFLVSRLRVYASLQSLDS